MMPEVISFVKQTGAASLGSIWFPLLLWTVAALAVWAVLKSVTKTDVLYQYHIRVALIAGLPFSLILSGIVRFLPELFLSADVAELSLIVVQNPIGVTAGTGNSFTAVTWNDPNLLLGIATMLIAMISLVKLGQLVRDYSRLFSFSRNIGSGRLSDRDIIGRNYRVVFNDRIGVPFTFGWSNPLIVMPLFLKNDPEKCNIALRHELMHIKRADYLINTCILFIKSIFWFHPLLHLFHRDVKEYREISCDTEVLADGSISRKQYARLLFELAPRRKAYRKPVVSMSVNHSTLKKRIETMTKNTTSQRPVRKSLLYSLMVLFAISGFISCSDLQSTGFTNEDLARSQKEIETRALEEQPLYFINGEIPDQEEAKGTIAKIKPKYIKSVHVFKGQNAMDKYGSRGKNGVIELVLLNKEKAMSDLLDPSTDDPSKKESPAGPFYVVAEKMPKLVGGLKGLQEKIHYPEEAKNQGIEGRVIVQFIVNEQGQVENPQIVKGIGGGCDKEALRVVNQAEFEPGMQSGEPVRVQYSLPIVYRL